MTRPPSACTAMLPARALSPAACAAMLPARSLPLSACVAMLPARALSPYVCAAMLPTRALSPSACAAMLPARALPLSACAAMLPACALPICCDAACACTVRVRVLQHFPVCMCCDALYILPLLACAATLSASHFSYSRGPYASSRHSPTAYDQLKFKYEKKYYLSQINPAFQKKHRRKDRVPTVPQAHTTHLRTFCSG